MAYRIKLTPFTPELIKFLGRDTFRVKVVASDGEGLPNEVFLHQKTLVDPNTNSQQDEFVAVCSPYDLSIYPANTPAVDQSPAFFRKDTIDILVPGTEMAQDVINAVLEQVCHLITLLEKLDELEALAPVWCPSPPESSSSV